MNMKLIIDIDEKIYNTIVHTCDGYKLYVSKAIREGIPLEKIRDEIEAIPIPVNINDTSDYQKGEKLIKEAVLNIIDKYRGNNEIKELETE